jgi:Flp pilus assembly protein TadD
MSKQRTRRSSARPSAPIGPAQTGLTPRNTAEEPNQTPVESSPRKQARATQSASSKRPSHAQRTATAKKRPPPVVVGIIVLVAALFIVAGFIVMPGMLANRDIAQGDQFVKNGRSDLAEQPYLAATQEDGGSVVPWNALGGFYALNNRWSDALNAFNHILAIDPNYPHLNSHLATCYMNTKDILNAMKDAHAALKVDPNDPEALTVETTLQAQDGLALQDVDNIRRLAQVQPSAHNLEMLANVLVTKGLYTEAGPVIDQLLVVSPGDPFGRFMRAVAVISTDGSGARLAQAVSDLQQIVTEQSGNYAVHQYLGKGYLRQGNLKGAISELEEAARLRPTNKDVYLALIRAYQQAGDTAKSATAQAVFAAIQKQSDEAFRLEKLVVAQPDDFDDVLQLGSLYTKLGEFRAARRYLSHALQLRPDDPGVIQAIRAFQAAAGPAYMH